MKGNVPDPAFLVNADPVADPDPDPDMDTKSRSRSGSVIQIQGFDEQNLKNFTAGK
jgi:hypothetical protein